MLHSPQLVWNWPAPCPACFESSTHNTHIHTDSYLLLSVPWAQDACIAHRHVKLRWNGLATGLCMSWYTLWYKHPCRYMHTYMSQTPTNTYMHKVTSHKQTQADTYTDLIHLQTCTHANLCRNGLQRWKRSSRPWRCQRETWWAVFAPMLCFGTLCLLAQSLPLQLYHLTIENETVFPPMLCLRTLSLSHTLSLSLSHSLSLSFTLSLSLSLSLSLFLSLSLSHSLSLSLSLCLP